MATAAAMSLRGAHAEDSAEVEVLSANLDKLKSLTRKMQGSMNRLENNGRTVQDAIGPIYANTHKLQVTSANINSILTAIDRIRAPADNSTREEKILKSPVQQVGVTDFMASLDRTNVALGDLKRNNLRANQQAIADLSGLVQQGSQKLEDVFRETLMEDARPVEPLQYTTKDKPFPTIPEQKISKLRTINGHVATATAQTSKGSVSATSRIYSEIRGRYLHDSLQNLAAASLSTARKTDQQSIYRPGTNAISMYSKAIEGIYRAEYDNVCPVFSREEWSSVYIATCKSSLQEFAKTLNELNRHVQANLITDCYLGYEIVDVVANLAFRLENQTGELRRPIQEALKPVRDTAKNSLARLLDHTKTEVLALQTLPPDGGSVPVVAETMTRLQAMTAYLAPLSSLMTSIGDGGWKSTSGSLANSTTSLPSLKSFDVGADGRQLFAHYATDTIEALVTTLESKARIAHKSRSVQGVFLANNVARIDNGIRTSELGKLLKPPPAKIDVWKKTAIKAYTDAWADASKALLDVQHTARNSGAPRPVSGGPDSAAIVKALSGKEKDAIKEKFKAFNAAFDDLVAKHKTYRMEPEVRVMLAKAVYETINALYSRFWDRYHEIDKGRNKYVKYDKQQMTQLLSSLG